MKILYHPKRILGFEPYVAPEGFDRKAQPVDIYDVFERYYRNHRDARYIFAVNDTVTSSYILNSSYNVWSTVRTGYELSGTKYTFEYTPTLLGGLDRPAGNYTSIEVVDTSEYPSSGVIRIIGNNSTKYFIYTSKDATHFYGTSQPMDLATSNFRVELRIDWVGTNRYVIVSAGGSSPVSTATLTGATWIYAKNVYEITGTSTLKWIHMDDIDTITSYPTGAFWNGIIEGRLYLSNSATTINNYCFLNANRITEITFSNSITTLIDRAFSYCTGLTSLTLGSGLINIGSEVFRYDTNITGNLVIPDSVTTISQYAFANCTKLTGVTFGDSVSTIGYAAFFGNAAMVGTLTIPDTLTSLAAAAFGGTKYTSISSPLANYPVSGDVLYDLTTAGKIQASYGAGGVSGSLTIRSDTTDILAYAFYDNRLRTGTCTVPDLVTIIGASAFQYCTGFSALTLGSSVATIGSGAFSYNTNMTGTLVLPDSLVTISNELAFYNCIFSTLTIGSGSQLATIGNRCFENNPITNEIFLPSTLQTIGQSAFRNCAITGTLNIPSSVTTIGLYSFISNNLSAITSSSTNYPVSDNVLYDVKTAGSVKAFFNAHANTGTLTFRSDTTEIMSSTNYFNRTGTLNIPATVVTLEAGPFTANNNFSAITSSSTNYPASDNVLYDIKTSGVINAIVNARLYSGTLTFRIDTTHITTNFMLNCTARTGTLTLPASISTSAGSIGANAFHGTQVSTRPIFTQCNSLNNIQPGAVWNTFAFQSGGVSAAIPLHIPTGSTSYIIAPWTNTAIFSSVTADL